MMARMAAITKLMMLMMTDGDGEDEEGSFLAPAAASLLWPPLLCRRLAGNGLHPKVQNPCLRRLCGLGAL